MEMPRIILLQIFAACPAPAPPQCTIFLPIFSSTGFAAANAFSSPPHMKVSDAPLAPPVPPDTGASTDGTLGNGRAVGLGLIAGGCHQIEGDHLVAGLDQIGRHRPAHIAEADEC